MSVFVFLGPTVPVDEARTHLNATFLPPAAQGDVYRVTREHPRAIGIVDGYFSHSPSVWHKEILWAMSQGIYVFGAASMGALRAAELNAFGMEGIGWIFEAYRDGVLEDDDEVAVMHGPIDVGFSPFTEPMVNIRVTLEAAAAEGIIGADSKTAILQIGKSLFYQQRTYERILRRASEDNVRSSDIRALSDWLASGKIDQKRTDALQMFRVMTDFLSCPPREKRVNYVFNHTVMWDGLLKTFNETAEAHTMGGSNAT